MRSHAMPRLGFSHVVPQRALESQTSRCDMPGEVRAQFLACPWLSWTLEGPGPRGTLLRQEKDSGEERWLRDKWGGCGAVGTAWLST